MIPDASLDLVYMCHVLEHVGRMQLLLTVLEMARVLKPGGILRIAVPDLDRLIHIYHACGKDLKVVAPALMGGQDYPYNFHYSVFNASFLTDLLQRGGFMDVRPWDPTTATYHGFKDWASGTIQWTGNEHPVSLNLEGVRRA